jgi:hypothetical protein
MPDTARRAEQWEFVTDAASPAVDVAELDCALTTLLLKLAEGGEQPDVKAWAGNTDAARPERGRGMTTRKPTLEELTALPVHPAAALFPMVAEGKIRELARTSRRTAA